MVDIISGKSKEITIKSAVKIITVYNRECVQHHNVQISSAMCQTRQRFARVKHL